jgi:amino acid adenylation domain-containing protein
VTARPFVARLSRKKRTDADVQFIVLEEASDVIAREPVENVALQPESPNAAYVIFTSGSSGAPKGVEIHHPGLVNLLESMRYEPGIRSDDVLAAISNVTFDASVIDYFLPLASGACVAIASSEETHDPEKLSVFLQRHQVSFMLAVPVTWIMLMESGWTSSPHLKMLCGGEILSRRLANDLLANGGELWNLYGPTETTVVSSMCKVSAGRYRPSIGKPIANTRFYVLDSALNAVPPGMPGELCIAGDGLARGYCNQPQLTAEKFLKGSSGEERIYRTGDLVRSLSDGTFDFLGRVDNQVKIRGFRIELDEIRNVIEEDPSVQAAEVLVRKSQGIDTLIAYVIPHSSKSDHEGHRSELRKLLRDRLPDYMQPAALVFLERLPVTPSGKVDREALPTPEIIDVPSEGPVMAPRDPVETKLVEIWERVLGVRPIGIRTDFFDQGGYSLLVVRLFAQINKVFKRSLPIATIFRARTIEELATVIRGSTINSALVPIRPQGAKRPLFIVHSYLTYDSFRQTVDPERPLYGLQEREDDREHVFRVEDRVAEYVKEIRAVQADGPYHLIGWCAAGPLTVELARGLQTAGCEVAMVGLIDSSRPGFAAQSRGTPTSRGGLFARIRSRIDGHRRRRQVLFAGDGTLRYVYRVLYERLVARRDRMLLRYWRIVFRLSQRLGVSSPHFMYNLSRLKLDALDPFEGRITLFRATELESVHADSTLGWADVAKQGVDVVWTPGDHESMFKQPHVSVFGRLLTHAMEKGETEGIPTASHQNGSHDAAYAVAQNR